MSVPEKDPDPEIEAESLREGRLYALLVEGNIPGALAEAETWRWWPLDDTGLWLLVEAFFQSRRLECVGLLKRMLRNRHERDEEGVAHIEQMIETAKSWTASPGGA